MNRKRLKLNKEDKIICGLCSGVANYCNIDSSFIRLMCICMFLVYPIETTIIYIISTLFINYNK